MVVYCASIQYREATMDDIRKFYEARAANVGGRPKWVAEVLARQETIAHCQRRGLPIPPWLLRRDEHACDISQADHLPPQGDEVPTLYSFWESFEAGRWRRTLYRMTERQAAAKFVGMEYRQAECGSEVRMVKPGM
jgi:hypothetical protein